jgi:hypothetical protein
MKVYSLLSFEYYESMDYESSALEGVFGSVEDVLKCVEQRKWYCDDLGYVVSELGEKIEDVESEVIDVSFVRWNGELRSL